MKLRFYDLIVQLALQEENYLEACNAYQEVWDTEEIKADEAKELNVSYSFADATRPTPKSSSQDIGYRKHHRLCYSRAVR